MEEAKEKKYLFGPVPSRRLGLSLGVDIVPLKTCSQNCVYCQLGVHGRQTIERASFVDIDKVLGELKVRLAEGLRADFITFSGSGEPTLNKDIGRLIDGIRELTDIKIAVITNGTLLNDAAVRADCCKADVVLPSLDAPDAETFEVINRPHPEVKFDSLVEGLCEFRRQYNGKIWLEVFFVEGLNTGEKQVAELRDIIGRIEPDRVQLNTAVRPTADASAVRVDEARMEEIASVLGGNAEVVADFSRGQGAEGVVVEVEQLFEMLKRRPCSIADICHGLGIDRHEAMTFIKDLEKKGKIFWEIREGTKFFFVR